MSQHDRHRARSARQDAEPLPEATVEDVTTLARQVCPVARGFVVQVLRYFATLKDAPTAPAAPSQRPRA